MRASGAIRTASILIGFCRPAKASSHRGPISRSDWDHGGVCAGAAFAQAEAVLLIARLVRRFDFHIIKPQSVRPAARLTTRPAQQIMVRVTRAAA